MVFSKLLLQSSSKRRAEKIKIKIILQHFFKLSRVCILLQRSSRRNSAKFVNNSQKFVKKSSEVSTAARARRKGRGREGGRGNGLVAFYFRGPERGFSFLFLFSRLVARFMRTGDWSATDSARSAVTAHSSESERFGRESGMGQKHGNGQMDGSATDRSATTAHSSWS